MEQRLEVEILEGRHSRPAPAGTKETFENLLKEAGVEEGAFKFLLGRQIRGSCGAKKILIHNIDEKTGMILIKAQINGGKDQRFEFLLTLPNYFRQKPELFFKALEKGADLINNPVKESTPMKYEGGELNNQELKKEVLEKSKIVKERRPRGVGFRQFAIDDDSIFLFWLEVKELFKDENGVTRKELTKKFLIDYGHEGTCYRFITKLLRLKIFSETPVFKGSKRLVVGEKLKVIIDKFDNKPSENKKGKLEIFSDKIIKLQVLVEDKRRIEVLILEKEVALKNLQEELRKIKQEIKPEMQQAEEKLDALKKLLA